MEHLKQFTPTVQMSCQSILNSKKVNLFNFS